MWVFFSDANLHTIPRDPSHVDVAFRSDNVGDAVHDPPYPTREAESLVFVPYESERGD